VRFRGMRTLKGPGSLFECGSPSEMPTYVRDRVALVCRCQTNLLEYRAISRKTGVLDL